MPELPARSRRRDPRPPWAGAPPDDGVDTRRHPTPTTKNITAADAALAAARSMLQTSNLIVLLSGGASACMHARRGRVAGEAADRGRSSRRARHRRTELVPAACRASRSCAGRACRGDPDTRDLQDVRRPVRGQPGVLIGSPGPAVTNLRGSPTWGIVSGIVPRDARPVLRRVLAASRRRGGGARVAQARRCVDETQPLRVDGRHVAVWARWWRSAPGAATESWSITPFLGEAREAGATHVETVRAASRAPSASS